MKYALGVLAVIVVAFIAIILIVTRSSSTDSKNSPKKTTGLSVLDYDNADSAVSVTTQGNLVGEDQRQAVRITVTQNKRTVEILSGYEENVIKSESFANTPAAYSTFLHALNNANYTKERKGVTGDERGTCPNGNRYIYKLTTHGRDDAMRLWSNSCDSGQGTFQGNGPLIREMFQKQIPDYSKFISGTKIFN